MTSNHKMSQNEKTPVRDEFDSCAAQTTSAATTTHIHESRATLYTRLRLCSDERHRPEKSVGTVHMQCTPYAHRGASSSSSSTDPHHPQTPTNNKVHT